MSGFDWEQRAARLADQVTHPVSRWRPVIAQIPRHLFIPRWWAPTGPLSGWGDAPWALQAGFDAPDAWMTAAYRNCSLVTQIAGTHADRAGPSGTQITGRPTSSATLPGLIVSMFRHAMVGDGMDVLDVGTGSGYGTAVLSARLGDEHVTSIDVDPYLSKAAAERLDTAGLHPTLLTLDATDPAPLPGAYDRIVSTVAVRPIPASWLEALRPDGRLVTTITGTGLIITADKTPDGGATGRVEPDQAGFMATRSGAGDYPSRLRDKAGLPNQNGEQVTRSRYPVLDVREAWGLWSLLAIAHPGVEHHFQRAPDGGATAWMLHPDGSWARATSDGPGLAEVHQSGPRRLYDQLDRLRDMWLQEGSLPLRDAKVTITPEGVAQLRCGSRWHTTIGPNPSEDD